MPSPVVENAHDFHVSRLTTNYIPNEGRIECTLMTFVDDVESVLASHHQLADVGDPNSAIPSKEGLNLTEEGEHAAVDSLITAYLKTVFKLTSPTAELPLEISYLGIERDEDPYGMFIYFYVDAVQLTPKLTLASSFMLELYEDQQNVVVWKLDGESADYDLLTFDTRTCDFER